MWGNKGMKTQRQSVRQGIALIMAMVFIVIFAAISIGFLSLSSANTQTANNHRIGNGAFCSAQSGYEIIRYLASGIQVHGIYGTEQPTATMHEVYTRLKDRITASGMTCIALSPYPYTGAGPISISNVSLSADGRKTFSIELGAADPNTVYVHIKGNDGQASKRIRVNYNLAEHGHSVFDYGIATKGPLDMSGQSTITGVNLAVESDVFIDTSIVGDSFSIGSKASVQGDVHIVNQYATYSINGSVGGETGLEARDHVIIGVDPVNFPIPNVQHFRQFVTGPRIDQYTNLGNYATLDNATIAAGTNPTFSSDRQINGVLFIEQPNVVKFSGKVTIKGIIVGDSQPGTTSSANSIQFSGQVSCQDISTLQGEQFANLRNETGTFLIAPGFHADFTGQANVITGVIATAGVRFSGQAGGTINGSIINYASVPVTLQGQGNLQFNRSGTTINPAGFTPVKTLSINQSSYSEV